MSRWKEYLSKLRMTDDNCGGYSIKHFFKKTFNSLENYAK